MDDLSARFDHPGAEHTACPFWFWNGDLEPPELVRQIHLMYDQGIRAFVLHARKGLTVPYLSDAWFERCRVAIEHAASLGMKLWIYDEENWASGYAGGRVLARDPTYIGQNLALERHYVRGPASLRLALARPSEVRAVAAARIAEARPLPDDPLTYRRPNGQPASWTDRARHAHRYAPEEPLPLALDGETIAWEAPAGEWLVTVARQQPTDWNAAYSDCSYTDLINQGAVDAFIEETHERYYQRFAGHFGMTILGFFVDEPGFYNNFWDRNVGSITWTHDVAAEFARRRGYDLLPWLPALWEDLGERGARARYDYWRTVTELLRERFFDRLAHWCVDHGVLLTGHLEWEEWLFTMTRHSGNPFVALAPFGVPGVDKIDEVTDKLAEKLVASVAHANGRDRVLSETFALTGWKLAPPYMKRIVDYQYARGVNWLAPHGFYYSIADYRRRECPPSEFFQNPWWEHSRPLWDYVARLSAVLSQGDHVAPVALYYPIEQAWDTMTPEQPGPFDGRAWEPWQLPRPDLPVQRTDLSLIGLGLHLPRHQYDFDLVDHTVLASANVADGLLRVGREIFRVLVIPDTDTLHAPALRQALALAAAGGTVVFVGRLPARVVDGSLPDEWTGLRERLSRLDHPGFLAHARGRLGYVPEGIAPVAALLRTAIAPDVEAWVAPEDDTIVVTQEQRGGWRETTMRPLTSYLAYHRRRVGDTDVYLLVNESDRTFTATLRLAGGAAVEEWIAHSGERHALPGRACDGDRVALTLAFAPGQSYLLVARPGAPAPPDRAASVVETSRHLDEWRIAVAGRTWTGPPVSWPDAGLPWFSGRGEYRTTLTLDAAPAPGERIVLDLGHVFETAVVTVNGQSLPPLAFEPYRADVTEVVRPGSNELLVVVANTNANAFERRERPSGLLGPVRLLTIRGVYTSD